MLSISNQRRRLDAATDPELIPSNELVAKDANCSSSDSVSNVGRRAVIDELLDTDVRGKCRTDPDDECDAKSCDVFCSLPTIRVGVRRRSLRDTKPDKNYERRTHVGKVVKCIAKQADGATEECYHQLDKPSHAESDCRDSDSAIRCASISSIIHVLSWREWIPCLMFTDDVHGYLLSVSRLSPALGWLWFIYVFMGYWSTYYVVSVEERFFCESPYVHILNGVKRLVTLTANRDKSREPKLCEVLRDTCWICSKMCGEFIDRVLTVKQRPDDAKPRAIRK